MIQSNIAIQLLCHLKTRWIIIFILIHLAIQIEPTATLKETWPISNSHLLLSNHESISPPCHLNPIYRKQVVTFHTLPSYNQNYLSWTNVGKM